MKFILFFGIIAFMAKVALSRNANWGERQREDKLVFNKNIIVYPRYGHQQDRYIPYNPRLSNYNITAIQVKDNFRNHSGAGANIENGGIGKRFVIVRLLSRQSQGMNATILIYGKPKDT